jgi:uncharacterized membrane-anchored protein YjiN (DUF445 family)
MEKSQSGSQLQKLQGSELALGIQFSAAIGKDKSLILTTGVPLDMKQEGINQILDRVAAAIDRQDLKYRYANLIDFIAESEANLERNRAQLETYKLSAEAEWMGSGRKGPFQMRGQQEKEIQNYSNTERHLTDQIKKLRKDAEEMKKKIESL